MAEKKPSHPREYYSFDRDRIGLDLYRLLCVMFASHDFRRHSEGDPHHHPIGSLAANFEEYEIVSTLINIAISTRMIIDGPGSSRGGEDHECGILGPDLVTSTDAKPLTVREACNKIVHATTVRFDVEEDEDYNEYVTPNVYLYGEHKGLNWKATISVVEFAKGVSAVIY